MCVLTEIPKETIRLQFSLIRTEKVKQNFEKMKTEFVGNIAFVVEMGHIFVISGQTLTGAQRYA